MKRIKWVFALLALIIIIGSSFTVSAIHSQLDTQALSDKEVDNIVRQNEFVKITSYNPLAVNCFDVRDNHELVVGVDCGGSAIIAVFDSSGNFQYGFQKKKQGSFRVMWIGDSIAYYSIRSNLLFRIDENGEITDVCRVANTTENSIYDRQVLQSATREVGSTTYRMTNDYVFADALPGSFKKITKTDVESTTVIYDASSNQHVRMMVGVVGFFMLSSFIAWCIVVGVKRHCKKVRYRER